MAYGLRTKSCVVCGVEMITRNPRRTYCGLACFSAAVSPQRAGNGNANYRGGINRSAHVCPMCQRVFVGPKHRRYCSRACSYASQRCDSMRQCVVCGEAFRFDRNRPRKTCSPACRAQSQSIVRPRGPLSQTWRGGPVPFQCEVCGRIGARSGIHAARRFCSRRCMGESLRMEMMGHVPQRKRRDGNHNELIAAFRKLGWQVLDMSDRGGGVPDLLIGDESHGLHWVEIKNTKTRYGRRGLTQRQQNWADRWMLGRVHVVRTIDEVVALTKVLTLGKAAGDGKPPKAVTLTCAEDVEALNRTYFPEEHEPER